MATRIDLPGGGWAEIKDPDDLTHGDRKRLRRYSMNAAGIYGKVGPIRDSMAAVVRGVDDIPEEVAARLGAILDADDLDTLDDMQAAFIVVWTAAWGLAPGTTGPPLTMETVDDLPPRIFDALAKATTKLGDGSLDTSVEGAGDETSPTVPSGG